MNTINPKLHGFAHAFYILAFAIMLLGFGNAAYEYFLVEDYNEWKAVAWLLCGVCNFNAMQRIKSDAVLEVHKMAGLTILQAVQETYGKEALSKLTLSINKSLLESMKDTDKQPSSL